MHTAITTPRNERIKFILESLVEGTLELKHSDERYINLIKSDIVARGYNIVSEREDNQNGIYHLHIRRIQNA